MALWLKHRKNSAIVQLEKNPIYTSLDARCVCAINRSWRKLSKWQLLNLMSDGWGLSGRFVPLCHKGVHVFAGSSERKVLIWLFLPQSPRWGHDSRVAAEISRLAFMQLISFSPVGWSTKYYLHYLATLISPPWCQVLMTPVTDLQSAVLPAQCCLSRWLACHILNLHGHLLKHKHHYWGQKTYILMKTCWLCWSSEFKSWPQTRILGHSLFCVDDVHLNNKPLDTFQCYSGYSIQT